MRLEPWHVPLLVTAGIIVLSYLIFKTPGSWLGRIKGFLRTATLGLIAALLVAALVVAALGPDLADQLASVAAAIASFVALWLTYQSRRSFGSPRQATQQPAKPTPAEQGTAQQAPPAQQTPPAEQAEPEGSADVAARDGSTAGPRPG
ncbi:hypothetical protein O7627_35175 [Solwaraspora sp. WMMD1047]|uniref:hypothetical protein n=1 Tax=Solwaraspora sp. WMMD1047 TaxID=3016102 RepID=UPI002415C7B3|nr:hypothetical protein [Solwaraspora sp. WMMD1047]MDG4834513.1 hypothetical protein [Solwaraspora sp. WMMD1047]